MEEKIQLSPKKILSKEFKVNTRGYNPDEVDHYLDIIIKDYESFASMLNKTYDKIEEQEELIKKLKQQVSSLQRELEVQQENVSAMEQNVSSNVDILKRLSLLEKVVFSQKG